MSTDDNTGNPGGMEEIELDLTPLVNEQDTQAAPAVAREADFASSLETATLQSAAQAERQEEDLDTTTEDDKALWEDFNTPSQHVTMESPPTAPATLPAGIPALAAMRVGYEEAQAILERAGLAEITDEQAEKLLPSERRLVNIIRSLSSVWNTAYFTEQFVSGDWRQSVKHNDTSLSARKVKMDRVSDPVLMIRSSLGQGSLVQIPLWHTGIWVTMRAPSNSALLDLDQRVRMEKNTLGRYSNGMAFSNVEVYTVAAYARFALEHVYAATMEFDSVDQVDELLRTVKSTDYPQLLYGLLSAMYPDGYPFRQPCVANPNTCDFMDETILSIARLSWVDRDRLTAKQKRLMASRSHKMTRAELADYQAEFPFDNRAIKLNKTVTAYLTVPTLFDQIDAGYRWVDGIADSTNRAFGLKLSEVDRYRHITRAGMMTSLRQYAHWIDRLEIQEKDGVDPVVIKDAVKKDEALEVISGEDASLKLLDESIMKWIDNCSVSIIALNKSSCPKCQEKPSEELSTHPHLIPLDIGYVFFTLAALKIKRIEGAAAVDL